jgi:hypothetical protein
MRRNFSIVECFDATAAKAYLKRSRLEFIIWVVSFAVFTAIAVSLFSVYALQSVANSSVFLAFAIAFAIVDLGGLIGSIFSYIRYRKAMLTVIDSGEYIREFAATRAESALAELMQDVGEVVFCANGFYFGDIDTPYQLRVINGNNFSSNYQTSIVYYDGNYLVYKSALFSLIGQEQRVLHGSVPFDKITSVGIIKANGIDLFCSQLKVVFGSQCMLFALDGQSDYRQSFNELYNRVIKRTA